jgi:hypothetical protein
MSSTIAEPRVRPLARNTLGIAEEILITAKEFVALANQAISYDITGELQASDNVRD